MDGSDEVTGRASAAKRKRKQVSGISQMMELIKAQTAEQQKASASMHAEKMQRIDRLLDILARK